MQLPHTWLHGVRLQLVDDDDLAFESSNDEENSMDTICRIQLEFILECSEDDGSKMMQIPLGAIPTTCQERMKMQSLSFSMQHQRLGMSNKVLLQNYNTETSAAFVPLTLFHRYNKSGAGNADSPVLNVSDELVC